MNELTLASERELTIHEQALLRFSEYIAKLEAELVTANQRVVKLATALECIGNQSDISSTVLLIAIEALKGSEK
jgi:hypothetical protein